MHSSKTLHLLKLSKNVFRSCKLFGRRYIAVTASSCTASEKLSLSYDHGISSNKLLAKTIGQVLDETTEKFPDNEAVVFCSDDVRLTYSQFTHKVDDFASGLLSLGLQRGDRIGIWGQNHLQWLITFYAALKAGLIIVNVNPAYRASELEYALNKVQMKALVLMPTFKTSNYYEILCEVAPEIKTSHSGQLKCEKAPHLKDVIMSEGAAFDGTFSFNEVCELGGYHEKHELKELQQIIQADEPCNIQFTSGTTGNPKGATLTHHNLVNNAVLCGDYLGYDQLSRVSIPVPLYHCFGLTIGSLNCIVNGSTQVYPARGFDAHATLKSIHDERCNAVYGTPVMFIDMLNDLQFDQYDYTSLYTGVMAGSPCPVEVMRRIITDMHCKEMTCGYGLTETSPLANFCSRSSLVELRTSTVGQVVAHVEVKAIDESGLIVDINEPGELCYRGHCVMHGYWQDEMKTKEAIDEHGWFHTGDLGVIDEDGYCKIVGRLKDLIIRGGENIYPTEIENFLHKHPKILDVQVVGIPDERMGEEVCAWIKLKPDVTCDTKEIVDFCKGTISHYKIPRYIHFVEEYPMTVTGKVKKFEIRKEMIEYLKEN